VIAKKFVLIVLKNIQEAFELLSVCVLFIDSINNYKEKKKLQSKSVDQIQNYKKYKNRKRYFILALFSMILMSSVVALSKGATNIDISQVILGIMGNGTDISNLVIWNIRIPRLLAGLFAGAGLGVAACVMQNNLRNPLASPTTLGISSGAAFGANFAIIILGAGTVGSVSSDSVLISSPYLVTLSAFISAIIGTMIIISLARLRGFSPEAMILSGVALSSLFSAGTIIIQYFAQDIEIAAAVFWTFGNLGRIAWSEVYILIIVVMVSFVYFMFKRWDYNTLDSGEDTAKSLGVNIERTRLIGMCFSSIVTAVTVSFLGIIGFVGLVSPHIMRRLIGNDYRYLIPASALAGSLLLVISDILSRMIISPIVLPVGAITSFFGAPLFIYIL
jgi:iron complex transport system permease protein